MDIWQERGIAIAESNQVEKNKLGWKVSSQSGNGTYIVNIDNEPFCTCQHFEETHEKCQHIYAIEFIEQQETREDGTTTCTKSMRITYSQVWPVYNMAQRNEKKEFMRLLYDLCQTIPQPEYIFGRPRLPLSDMVFCAALKVYSTVSGRRFMTDLETAFEKGYICQLPHYNSVFNYLEDESLTPLLKRLIESTSNPLKHIETSFAVDSTGFSTCKFDRWYDTKYGKERSQKKWLKAHIMCGTTTNTVVSIEITPSNVNDSVMLKPLVDNTVKRFNLAEISADKAYASDNNLNIINDAGSVPYIPFKMGGSTGRGVRKSGSAIWTKMYHMFMFHQQEFMQHYHKRSNVESTFAMIKMKFGDAIRSRGHVSQVNELLLKVLCHNICVLIQSIYELGISDTFWAENAVAQKASQN